MLSHIQPHPQHAFAKTQLGQAMQLSKQGKQAEAIQTCLQAIATEPQYADAHYSLGLLYDLTGQTGLALNSFTNAITSSQRNSSEAFYKRGCMHLKLNNPDSAITDFQRVVPSSKYGRQAQQEISTLQAQGHTIDLNSSVVSQQDTSFLNTSMASSASVMAGGPPRHPAHPSQPGFGSAYDHHRRPSASVLPSRFPSAAPSPNASFVNQSGALNQSMSFYHDAEKIKTTDPIGALRAYKESSRLDESFQAAQQGYSDVLPLAQRAYVAKARSNFRNSDFLNVSTICEEALEIINVNNPGSFTQLALLRGVALANQGKFIEAWHVLHKIILLRDDLQSNHVNISPQLQQQFEEAKTELNKLASYPVSAAALKAGGVLEILIQSYFIKPQSSCVIC